MRPEVLARLGPRATLIHEPAAEHWGIELVGERRDRVTVPAQRGRARVPGWVVRRLDLTPDEVVVVDGVRLTVPLRTVLESLLRLLLLRAGLPAPLTQHPIVDRDGRWVARVDFCWPGHRLVVETDGFAFHSDRAAYRSDREQGNDLERLGWRVLRFTWEDVVGRPDHVVAVVRACLGEAIAA